MSTRDVPLPTDYRAPKPDLNTGRGLAAISYKVAQGPLAGHARYVLPLPGHKPGELSLNARGHWAPRAKAIRALKAAVLWRCREARVPTGLEHVHVQVHYVPKDRRKRDADNLMGVHKAAVDGLRKAEIIADDDPSFVSWTSPKIHEPDAHGPRMWLEVTPAPAFPRED